MQNGTNRTSGQPNNTTMKVSRPASFDSTTLAIADHLAALIDEEGSMTHPDQPHGTADVRVMQDQNTGEVTINVMGRRFQIVLDEIL